MELSRRTLVLGALAAPLVAALGGCGVTDDYGEAGTGRIADLRFMVPNSPGGGYDITARTAAKVMDDAGISQGTEVFNLAGAGGTVGLARLVNERGNSGMVMMMGLGVVGSVYTQGSDATLAQTTPLAKVIEEPGVVMVSRDSPFATLQDLVDAWTADPGSVSVGGGSSPGGPDHLLPMQLAQTLGIEPRDVSYVPYDGGGELLPAILGGKVDIGASGPGEYLDQIESGEVRVLAVTSAERQPTLDAPTLQEQGVDMVFTNWRGIVAPPGITGPESERLVTALEQMHASPGWKQALEERGWVDAFETGEDFRRFLEQQDARVSDVLTQLGLA